MKLTKLAFAMTIALTGCTSQTEHLKSLNPEYFDKDTPVGEDFYHHVNRGWQKAHPLTDEYARYGNFNILADTAEVRVRDLVLGVSDTNPAPSSVAHKVATIYSLGMDSVRLNKEGATPILADLKRIEDTPHEGMEDLFLWMHGNYASPFFSAGPMEDMGNSNAYAMYVGGGGMGLGDRDYYLLDDERNTEVREAYKKLIEDCWNQKPNKRPSFDDICQRLKTDKKFITELVEEQDFLDYVSPFCIPLPNSPIFFH